MQRRLFVSIVAMALGTHPGFSSAGASPSALEWILTSSPTTSSEMAVGGGKLVVPLPNGRIISWPLDQPENRSNFEWNSGLTSVAFGEGVFVVAAGNALLSSSNAVEWVSQPFAGDLGTQVIYGDGIFLARSSQSLVRSTDGFTWAEVAKPSTNGNRGIQFIGVPGAEGVFHFRDLDAFYQSPDGLNWTQAPADTLFISKYAYGNGRFVGIGPRYEVFTSTDGIHWNPPQDLGVSRSSIAFGNGYFVLVGPNARAYSRDGISWTKVPNSLTSYNVIFANGVFFSGTFTGLYRSVPVVNLSTGDAGEIAVFGVTGESYRIESMESVHGEWQPQATFTMPSSAESYSWSDPRSAEGQARFYRAVRVLE